MNSTAVDGTVRYLTSPAGASTADVASLEKFYTETLPKVQSGLDRAAKAFSRLRVRMPPALSDAEASAGGVFLFAVRSARPPAPADNLSKLSGGAFRGAFPASVLARSRRTAAPEDGYDDEVEDDDDDEDLGESDENEEDDEGEAEEEVDDEDTDEDEENDEEEEVAEDDDDDDDDENEEGIEDEGQEEENEEEDY